MGSSPIHGSIAHRVTNAVQTAITELGDGYGMAEAGAVQTPGAANISGHDPRHHGRAFVNQLVLGETCGPAAAQADGWVTLGDIGSAGLMFLDSVEVDELRFPILVGVRRFSADTEDARRYRGAPSSEVEFAPPKLDAGHLRERWHS